MHVHLDFQLPTIPCDPGKRVSWTMLFPDLTSRQNTNARTLARRSIQTFIHTNTHIHTHRQTQCQTQTHTHTHTNYMPGVTHALRLSLLFPPHSSLFDENTSWRAPVLPLTLGLMGLVWVILHKRGREVSQITGVYLLLCQSWHFVNFDKMSKLTFCSTVFSETLILLYPLVGTLLIGLHACCAGYRMNSVKMFSKGVCKVILNQNSSTW